MTTDYDRANAALQSASARSSMRSTREIMAEQAAREHAARQQDPTRREQPTAQERTEARIARSAEAWRQARAKVAGWPADLARAELERTAQHFGREPGATGVSDRQAAALLRQLPGDGEPERPAVDPATARSAEILLRGTRTPEEEAEARRRARPPADAR